MDTDDTVSIEDTSYDEENRLLRSFNDPDELRTTTNWSEVSSRVPDFANDAWEEKRNGMTKSEDLTQVAFFWTQTIINLGLAIFTLVLLLRVPMAISQFMFYGIVGPGQIILMVIGFVATFYGGFAIYKRNVPYTTSRVYFRRYLRTNKFYILNWIMSTSTCVFGCWKYQRYLEIDKKYPLIEDIHKNFDYGSFVKEAIVGITNLFWIIRSLGISLDDSPFSAVVSMGKNAWVTALCLVVLPSAILTTGVVFQHRYYLKKYFQPVRS